MQIALKIKTIYLVVTTVLITWALFVAMFSPVFAAEIDNRSLTLSNPNASASNVNYDFRFDIVGNYSLGSIVFELCAEDPLPNQPCTAPIGLNSTSRSLSLQTGETGFSIDPASTNERIILTRPAQVNTNNSLRYTFSGITNPATNATHFARIYTHSSSDGSGPAIDFGGIAYVTNPSLNYDAEVPPFLFFCSGVTISGLVCRNNDTASGLFIDFGEFVPVTTKRATSQVMAATNARSGYNIYVNGKSLTSGNNVIPGLSTATASQTGVSQFGMNLRNNSNPNVGEDPAGIGAGFVHPNYNNINSFRFNDGDVIARSTGTSDFKKFTISYIVNVSPDQDPGTYSTTLTYVCLANF